MDTVFECDECGQELRYSSDGIDREEDGTVPDVELSRVAEEHADECSVLSHPLAQLGARVLEILESGDKRHPSLSAPALAHNPDDDPSTASFRRCVRSEALGMVLDAACSLGLLDTPEAKQ
jgi:hypothetical protein